MYKCDICGKKFGRKYNLERHLLRHKDDDLFQCNECGVLFSRKDNLQRYLEQVHNQTGGGLKRKVSTENSATKKRRLTQKDKPDRFYDLRVVSGRNLPFRTTSTAYKVTFKELDVRGLPQILKMLQLLFQSLIKDMTEFMKSDVLIRMSIQCPELDFPITISFMKVAQLSAETMLREIERVFQSYEQFVLDSSLQEIEITHVDMPKGSGRKSCKFVDIGRFLKDKKCIIQIQNNDKLCCARALVTAKANIDKHQKWESIRKGCKIQLDMAIELHEKANIPLRACDLEDIKQFQSVMNDCQMHVVSKDHFNGIIFQGPEVEKKIYLYYHNEHYDVITSMPAFLNRSYYCNSCQKGYQNKEEHK